MYRKKNPQMAISSYSFLSVHRQPQEPLAGAAGAAGAPGWRSRGSSPTLWDGLLFRVKNVEEF